MNNPWFSHEVMRIGPKGSKEATQIVYMRFSGTKLEFLASGLGLWIATSHPLPGGKKRIRFFGKPMGFDEADGLFTAKSGPEAIKWLRNRAKETDNIEAQEYIEFLCPIDKLKLRH